MITCGKVLVKCGGEMRRERELATQPCAAFAQNGTSLARCSPMVVSQNGLTEVEYFF